MLLAAHDDDPFNRWDASQQLVTARRPSHKDTHASPRAATHRRLRRAPRRGRSSQIWQASRVLLALVAKWQACPDAAARSQLAPPPAFIATFKATLTAKGLEPSLQAYALTLPVRRQRLQPRSVAAALLNNRRSSGSAE